MFLTVLTPHKKIVDRTEVKELFVPGAAGTLDILDLHANLVTQLETGTIRWRSKDKWDTAALSTGFLEIFNDEVTIVADVSELGQEIDVDRAKRAKEVATRKLEEGGLDDTSQRKYELKLKRAMARVSASSPGDS
jgi:F-type H+-transporting ATPase subunit epsilon